MTLKISSYKKDLKIVRMPVVFEQDRLHHPCYILKVEHLLRLRDPMDDFGEYVTSRTRLLY